jgi:hypothetical protein
MTPRNPHRISDLLGCTVASVDNEELGVVKDVRLAPTAAVVGIHAELAVAGVVVGKRYTGAWLGYDRQATQGPWLVRTVVRWLHRDSGYVPWSAISDVDWSRSVVYSARHELEPLSHVRDR